MPKPEDGITEPEDEITKPDNSKDEIDNSLATALDIYKKVCENQSDDKLTDEELLEIEKKCKIIEKREIISRDSPHEPLEITFGKNEPIIGPPKLTRFEKARVLGARTLQLSLGAPSFIEIPKNGITSLQIAMMELEQRLLPIVIKRTLPNGDYQNIPMNRFE